MSRVARTVASSEVGRDLQAMKESESFALTTGMNVRLWRAGVERHAEKRISRSLIKLTVKDSLLLDFELKQRMTRRQVDVVADARVPTADDQASRVGIGFDFVN